LEKNDKQIANPPWFGRVRQLGVKAPSPPRKFVGPEMSGTGLAMMVEVVFAEEVVGVEGVLIM